MEKITIEKYGYKREVALSFTDAVQKIKEGLAKEGFGVLTEIDVKATFKKKLDIDYENYLILGACNPSFAFKALEAEKDLGLFLPCNVIVYGLGAKTFVSAIVPSVAMGMISNPALSEIAKEIEQKLKKVIDMI